VLDWSAGRYEETAAELDPVARRIVEMAGIALGDRVLDLACGTGNASLWAARAGATVTGLDAAARLVDVARGRASAESLDATFQVGNVEELPFADDSFDVVLSVFGVIFADPDRAVAEALRVLGPGRQALFSVWVPAGALDKEVGIMGRAMAEVTGQSRPRFAWHDEATVNELAARHGATAEVQDGSLEFTGESPEAYFTRGQEGHPMSIAARPVLEQAGVYERVRADALAALREGNEDPAAFRITSPYRIVILRPS
jgi:SAM-dependent methyltransferase